MAGPLAAVKMLALTNAALRLHSQNMVKTNDPAPEKMTREERLAQALRDNLRKRKAQARAGRGDAGGDVDVAGQPPVKPPVKPST